MQLSALLFLATLLHSVSGYGIGFIVA